MAAFKIIHCKASSLRKRQIQDACQLVQVDAALFGEVLRHCSELCFVLALNQVQALHDGCALPTQLLDEPHRVLPGTSQICKLHDRAVSNHIKRRGHCLFSFLRGGSGLRKAFLPLFQFIQPVDKCIVLLNRHILLCRCSGLLRLLCLHLPPCFRAVKLLHIGFTGVRVEPLAVDDPTAQVRAVGWSAVQVRRYRQKLLPARNRSAKQPTAVLCRLLNRLLPIHRLRTLRLYLLHLRVGQGSGKANCSHAAIRIDGLLRNVGRSGCRIIAHKTSLLLRPVYCIGRKREATKVQRRANINYYNYYKIDKKIRQSLATMPVSLVVVLWYNQHNKNKNIVLGGNNYGRKNHPESRQTVPSA
nr:MAG TPA: hypothetical protein [Caudoviricetes sp.]